MGPMRGSCIGAALFEGWAQTEEEALALLRAGEVEFTPCHHCHAVGPMGGITSANMAVVVVRNVVDDTVAYCTMNEGIGKVLRFGAYSQEVVDRLHWMADELGPVLSAALKLKDGGVNLNVLIARAITQGDEFHQRNMAASLNLLKELAPFIVQTDVDEAAKQCVIQFLADTDQFFLNIMPLPDMPQESAKVSYKIVRPQKLWIKRLQLRIAELCKTLVSAVLRLGIHGATRWFEGRPLI